MKLTDKDINEIAQSLDCGMRYFIHKETKKIVEVPDFEQFGVGDYDEYVDMIDEEDKDLEDAIFNPFDYHIIEQMNSREGFQVMEDFAEMIGNRKLQERLIQALSGYKPFRNFKYIIDNSDVREDWFRFKQARYEEYVREALERLFG